MRSFFVTCLVEFTDEEHKDWSEGADETFSIARKLSAQENGVHLVDYTPIPNDSLPKYRILTEEGGI
jgi:ADP-ribose pyrophosphatase YjhB (NUDIX family)